MFQVGDVVYLKKYPEGLLTVSIVFGITKNSRLNEFLVRQYRKFGFVDGDVQCICHDGKNIFDVFFKANMLNLKTRCNTPAVFNVGDRVFLKSNPEVLMTVTNVIGCENKEVTRFIRERFERKSRKLGYADGDVQCKWSNGRRYKFDMFYAAMLDKVK
jgi:uncharacterized protein YodC (DUF2158 family)